MFQALNILVVVLSSVLYVASQGAIQPGPINPTLITDLPPPTFTVITDPGPDPTFTVITDPTLTVITDFPTATIGPPYLCPRPYVQLCCERLYYPTDPVVTPILQSSGIAPVDPITPLGYRCWPYPLLSTIARRCFPVCCKKYYQYVDPSGGLGYDCISPIIVDPPITPITPINPPLTPIPLPVATAV